MIFIENNVLKNFEYESIINEFISSPITLKISRLTLTKRGEDDDLYAINCFDQFFFTQQVFMTYVTTTLSQTNLFIK